MDRSERELFTAQSAREHVVWCSEDISHLILSLDAAEQALPEGSRVCGPDEVLVKRSDLNGIARLYDGTLGWECVACNTYKGHEADCWLSAAIGDAT